MKILHVINSFNIGGAEKMLFEILKENKNKNIFIIWFSFFSSYSDV